VILLLSLAVLRTPAAWAQEEADKTGTNPLNLQQSAILFNEYQNLPDGGKYANILNFRYLLKPFAIGKGPAQIRLTLPVVSADRGGGSDFGIGDFNARLNWVPTITPKYGIVVGLETSWNTASEDQLGTGRNYLAPVVIYAMFLPSGLLFAPAYQQIIDIGGDSDRQSISSGVFDFYMVKPVKTGKGGWWILDPTLTLDYKHDTHVGGQIELERGFIIGPMGKGVASWYIRPGIGIGAFRAYDWNLEAGYKLVGF
jgi:hypothetical protein